MTTVDAPRQPLERRIGPDGRRVLRAPFPWFGGKSRAADVVWRAFGNVPNYVEPFAGSLAVLLARPHTPKVETANDKDGLIANFWRATRDKPDEVARWADWPVNEADLHARHRWLVDRAPGLLEKLIEDAEYSDAKIAGWWVWGICTDHEAQIVRLPACPDLVVYDIGMRMLVPRELFRAQGFADAYVIELVGPRGKALTKTEQVRLVGNSVCPDVAEALVRAAVAGPSEVRWAA